MPRSPVRLADEWKTLRRTDALEDLDREFGRRAKTRGSFSIEAAGVPLLWSLVAVGQIRVRRIDGHRFLSELTRDHGKQVA